MFHADWLFVRDNVSQHLTSEIKRESREHSILKSDTEDRTRCYFGNQSETAMMTRTFPTFWNHRRDKTSTEANSGARLFFPINGLSTYSDLTAIVLLT